MDAEPLVSVGVPAYNRPDGLNKALASITGQTYRNLEIIVSDNASTHPGVLVVLDEWQKKDARIIAIRHETNLGAFENFKAVLQKSSGDYFMWAADDDSREAWFIARCLDVLLENTSVAAVTTETMFFLENGDPLPFFPQGSAFYHYKERPPFHAVCHALDNNFDNLIYALFRKSSLFYEGRCVWMDVTAGSGNEIPAILYAASQGSFVVLPDVGFKKNTSLSGYKQAYWEVYGGKIPETSRVRALRSALMTTKYHLMVMIEISRAVQILNFSFISRTILRFRAFFLIFKHLIWMIKGWKPAQKNRSIANEK